MAVRSAEAVWTGNLREGKGSLKVESGAFEGPYSFPTRFEGATGETNPEELIGAAHAGCFSMSLAAGLSRAGFTPTRIHTTAKVHIERGDSGFQITTIELVTEAEVPNLDEATFQEQAQSAKQNCPISKALAGPEIKLDARLL